jgi:hypothetical protein
MSRCQLEYAHFLLSLGQLKAAEAVLLSLCQEPADSLLVLKETNNMEMLLLHPYIKEELNNCECFITTIKGYSLFMLVVNYQAHNLVKKVHETMVILEGLCENYFHMTTLAEFCEKFSLNRGIFNNIKYLATIQSSVTMLCGYGHLVVGNKTQALLAGLTAWNVLAASGPVIARGFARAHRHVCEVIDDQEVARLLNKK